MEVGNFARAFFEEHGMVRHHIDSFNEFLNVGMQRVVDEIGGIDPTIIPEGCVEFKIKFGKISVGDPVVKEADGSANLLSPMESRFRELTYAAPVRLELVTEKDGIRGESVEAIIGDLPLMVKSDACILSKLGDDDLVDMGEDPMDPGGYFIINGTERVLIAIEDLQPNMPLLENKEKGPARQIARLFSEAPGFRVPHLFERLKNGVVRLSFARVSRIPAVALMMALGVTSDQQIITLITENPELAEEVIVNLKEIPDSVDSREDALDWIGKQMKIGRDREYRLERVQDLLDQYLLPHIGDGENSDMEKAHYVGNVMEKLIELEYGLISEDDKDHYGNKRLKLAGELVEQLFRAAFKALVNDMKYSFERITKRGREPPIATIVRSQLLTSRLSSALATGYWVGGRSGVSQHLQRLNYMDTLSHLRRVLSPLTTSQPHFEARELHPTHWGILCASETPEGQNIGLRKNLALFAKMTYDRGDDKKMREILDKLGVKPPEGVKR